MTLSETLKTAAADAIHSKLTGQAPRPQGMNQHSTPSGPTPWPPSNDYQPAPQSYRASAGPMGGHSGQDASHKPSSSNLGASIEKFLTGSKTSASDPKPNGKTDYGAIAEKFLLGSNHKDKKDPWGIGGGGWTGMGSGGGSSSGLGMGESSHGRQSKDPWGLGTKEDWGMGKKEDWKFGGSGKNGKMTRKDLKDLEDAQDAMDAADIAKQIKADGGEIDDETAEAIVRALAGV